MQSLCGCIGGPGDNGWWRGEVKELLTPSTMLYAVCAPRLIISYRAYSVCYQDPPNPQPVVTVAREGPRGSRNKYFQEFFQNRRLTTMQRLLQNLVQNERFSKAPRCLLMLLVLIYMHHSQNRVRQVGVWCMYICYDVVMFKHILFVTTSYRTLSVCHPSTLTTTS